MRGHLALQVAKQQGYYVAQELNAAVLQQSATPQHNGAAVGPTIVDKEPVQAGTYTWSREGESYSGARARPAFKFSSQGQMAYVGKNISVAGFGEDGSFVMGDAHITNLIWLDPPSRPPS